MTPGQHEPHDVAGALDRSPGTLRHCVGPRHTNALCRDRLGRLEASYPAERDTRLDVVVDHDNIHQAQAVAPWLASHPRVTWLWWPTSGPRAHPIERACGDVHDCCTRTHQRNRLPDLGADGEDPLHRNGPWPYKRSDRYSDSAVTAVVEKLTAEARAKTAA